MHQPPLRRFPGPRRAIVALLALCGCQLAWAASASATVQLTAATYNVSENAGQAVIVVTRTGALLDDEYVRYGSHRLGAVQDIDYENVGGVLHFLPLQAVATYTIPITRYNFNGPPVNFSMYLYGSWPDKMATPHSAVVTIQHDTPLERRDPANPLELNPAPANGNPLSGASWFVDPVNDPAGLAAAQYRRSNPDWARKLSVIANQRSRCASACSPARTSQSASSPICSRPTCSTPTPSRCCRPTESGGTVQGRRRTRHTRADRQLRGLRSTAVLRHRQLPSGAVPGDGLDHHGRVPEAERQSGAAGPAAQCDLHLQRNPHLVVYLDAGAADAHPWQWTAKMLNLAGVHMIQGFFLNSTHFDWTTKEIAYGQKIAR
jgi:endoglucanase